MMISSTPAAMEKRPKTRKKVAMTLPASSASSTSSRLMSLTVRPIPPPSRVSPSAAMMLVKLSITSSVSPTPSRTPPRFEMAMMLTSPGRSKICWSVSSRVTSPSGISKLPTPVVNRSSTMSTMVNSCGWSWTKTCTRSPGSAASASAALLFRNASSAARELMSSASPVVAEMMSGKPSSESASSPTKVAEGSLRRLSGLIMGTCSNSIGR